MVKHIVLIGNVKLRSAVLTCDHMAQGIDERWFKVQKRKAGVTNGDIGALRGRDHTVISKLVSGAQPMTFDWAEAFAEALQVPVAEVLAKAGVSFETKAEIVIPGFSEGDATPWEPKQSEDRKPQSVAEIFGARPGVDVWRLSSRSMAGSGYLPGDYILVDTHAADKSKPGDVVLAQVYNRNGTARTVLRRWMPPVLISDCAPGDVPEVHVLDHDNVLIRGRVLASWRV